MISVWHNECVAWKGKCNLNGGGAIFFSSHQNSILDNYVLHGFPMAGLISDNLKPIQFMLYMYF